MVVQMNILAFDCSVLTNRKLFIPFVGVIVVVVVVHTPHTPVQHRRNNHSEFIHKQISTVYILFSCGSNVCFCFRFFLYMYSLSAFHDIFAPIQFDKNHSQPKPFPFDSHCIFYKHAKSFKRNI